MHRRYLDTDIGDNRNPPGSADTVYRVKRSARRLTACRPLVVLLEIHLDPDQGRPRESASTGIAVPA
jgi:hypothetical protein